MTASSALRSRRILFVGSCALLGPGTDTSNTESCFSSAFRAVSVPSFHLLFRGDPSPASQLSLLLWKLLSQMKTSQHGSGIKPRHLHMPLLRGDLGLLARMRLHFLCPAGQGHSGCWGDAGWAAREPFPVSVCWNVGQQPVLQHQCLLLLLQTLQPSL